MVFHAYMLLCSDGSYYTGHTDNLEYRIAQHRDGSIAAYTKSRRPIRLVWSQEFSERHEALAAERQIKGWSRAKKEALIDRRWDELSRLSRNHTQFALRQAQGERLFVSDAVVRQLLEAARAAFPQEACGVLLGDGERITGFVETRNVHDAPETHFEIDPQVLIDAHREARSGGPEVVGYFHSHPTGKPMPSETDRAMAARDGRVWAIAAGDSLAFWRDEASGFAALSYAVTDG